VTIGHCSLRRHSVAARPISNRGGLFVTYIRDNPKPARFSNRGGLFVAEKGQGVAKAKRAVRSRATRAGAASKCVRTQLKATRKNPKALRAGNSITPLDVMLGAMRELWERAAALKGKADCEDERLALIRQASAEAHKAAVYVHPRMASIGPGEEEEDQTPAKSFAMTGDTPPLGSRELARRLLFAVAVAEHFSIDRDPEEKP
jgi:hypothetical protein